MKKIIIAEDDHAISEVIKLILELEGYKVSCTNGKGFMQKIKEESPDLLLLDVWMGKNDGRKLCQSLKNESRTQHIPIIMVSATSDLEKTAKDSGADDFLAKPFELEDLISKVKKYTH